MLCYVFQCCKLILLMLLQNLKGKASIRPKLTPKFCNRPNLTRKSRPRPGATGGISGPCPPNWLLVPSQTKLCPPSEDCAPKKLTGSGLLERNSRSKLVFFVDWHRILWRFWDEDLFFFFFGEHLFLAGKTAWISDFGRKIPCNFSEDLFFGDHLFSAEKPLKFPILAGKSLWLFAPHLVYLIQTGINFSCPRAPLEFTQNKLLVHPKNLFLPPPVTLFWRRACSGPTYNSVLKTYCSNRYSEVPAEIFSGGGGGASDVSIIYWIK